MLCCLSLTACDLFFGGKLKECLLTNNEVEKYFSWQSVARAEGYEIYLNDQLIDTVDDTDSTCVFDYSSYTTEVGSYVFKTRSYAQGYETSEFSNQITVLVESIIENNNSIYQNCDVVTNNNKSTTITSAQNGVIEWMPVENAVGYVVMVFNNTDGLNYYHTDGNFISVKNIPNENVDVLAIKIATLFAQDNTLYINSNGLHYYNPCKMGDYTTTSSIYLFDGAIYDRYIQSEEELKNYAYYNFINRNAEYSMLISFKFKNYIEDLEDDYGVKHSVKSYLREIIPNSYRETYSYMDNLQISSKSNIYGYSYTITWTLHINQPILTNIDETTGIGTGRSEVAKDVTDTTKYVRQYGNAYSYYEKAGLIKRSASYDNFASDNKFLSVEVESTEQLFWTVEGGFTPTFADTDSRAYHCYQNVKNILRNIIAEGMTDYEKVLSIFDYLCENYVYDWYAYYSTGNPMQYTCYYLESLFLDTNNFAVCDAYAKAFSLMCNMEGIDCIRVTGLVYTNNPSSGHAWNKVKIGDNWYAVDITNTEVKADGFYYFNGSQYVTIPQYEIVSHKLFLVSDDYLGYSTYSGRARNVENDCDNNYYHYEQNNGIDIYLSSANELNALLQFMKTNQINGMDFVVTQELYEYLTTIIDEENDICNFDEEVDKVALNTTGIYLFETNSSRFNKVPLSDGTNGILAVLYLNW